MPKRIIPLSEMQVKKAKSQEQSYKLFDGGGLFLLVTPTGGKLWRFKYRFQGKELQLTFGKYPDVSLIDARQKRDAARKSVADGIDPGEVKKAQRTSESSNTRSLEVVARCWHASKKPEWSESHAKTTLERLEKNIFPWLGGTPVELVGLSEIRGVLQRIEERAPESARRMYVALNMILRYCVVSGFIERSPLGGLTPKDVLRREPIEQHHAAITNPADLGVFLRSVDRFNGTFVVKQALKMAPLIFQRPGDQRYMEWADINFDSGEWNIPVEKMKLTKKQKAARSGESHCVPLSRQVIAILEELRPLTGRSRYVFPGARSYHAPLSEAAVTAALHRMGYQNVQSWHGFRATARTILDEVLSFPPDIIEHQLAHAVRDPLGRAYNRTTKLPQRREMMQAWADYLDSLKGIS